METHYPDYSEMLSAAVSKTVRQETPRQKEPAIVHAFMLHPLIHTSIYLSTFLSLSLSVTACYFLASFYPLPVHMSLCQTTESLPAKHNHETLPLSLSLSPPSLPALESSFVTVGPSPSLRTCFFN